jgi:DNA-binding beta-propeller fold protein YncE
MIFTFSSPSSYFSSTFLGSSGNASNQFINPFGLALNPTSDVLYIADCDNHRIMSYASGVNTGTLVLGGIGPGTSNTQLYRPIGVHIDLITNSLAIVNSGCNNIVRYVLGTSSNWTLIAGNINGSSGATSASFNYPTEVTLDPMGNIYVADGFNERIQFFYANQLNGTTIMGFTAISGNNATTLNRPLSVRLDSQLNLYVADSLNHRIQKFLRY